MASHFHSLVAYRLSVDLADELHSLVSAWPALDRDTLGIQLIRSADSVGANIAEAFGRWTDADQRRILYIARGSLYETEHWLARARVRGLIHTDLSSRIAEIARSLNGLIDRKRRR
jgi:four helix bundle protein